MHPEDLDRLEQAALSTIELKTKAAREGHDWVVDSHSLTSTNLLELVALARLGYPVWKRAGNKNRSVVCVNSACEWHLRGQHTHPEDGTIESRPVFC